MRTLIMKKSTEIFFSLILFIISHSVDGFHNKNNNSKNVVKRMDIQTCVGQFDVQYNMIIKSDESIKLGAKFLDDTDVGSKDECLHFCCETDNCNVYVYEEKESNTCYLFNCGPPQDFRCKFTKHSNFTSAIFSIKKKTILPTAVSPKQISIVPTRTILSQNEMDLKSLREHPSKQKVLVEVTTTVRPISQNHTNSCGRFQFPCHSGECIAVYNACDGIPQCKDGSDESPECKGQGIAYNNIVQNQVKNPAANFISHNREDPLTAPQWNQPNAPINEAPAHIFNHKGGLHIPETSNQIPQSNSQLQNQKPLYPIDSSYANNEENYRPAWSINPDLVRNWPQQMPQLPSKPLKSEQSSYPTMDLSKSWPVIGSNHPIHAVNHNNEEQLPSNTYGESFHDVAVSDKKKDGKNTIEKETDNTTDEKTSEYDDDEDDEMAKPTEPPKKKTRKHKKTQKNNKQNNEKPIVSKIESTNDDLEVEQKKIVHSKLQLEFADHDGNAEQPGGAVLSLTLGVIITVALVILLGCRTTVVRKRVRRGGKSYAHDADFLVNGMYL